MYAAADYPRSTNNKLQNVFFKAFKRIPFTDKMHLLRVHPHYKDES